MTRRARLFFFTQPVCRMLFFYQLETYNIGFYYFFLESRLVTLSLSLSPNIYQSLELTTLYCVVSAGYLPYYVGLRQSDEPPTVRNTRRISNYNVTYNARGLTTHIVYFFSMFILS